MDYRISKAVQLAITAHDGQKRKYTHTPYVLHSFAVWALLADRKLDSEVQIAGILHDVVEDTPIELQYIHAIFGERVAKLVYAVTDEYTPARYMQNRAERKRMECDRLRCVTDSAQSIKLADLIDNTASIVKYDPVFARVYLSEKRALLEVLTRGDRWLFAEAYRVLVDAENTLANLPVVEEESNED